MCSSNTGETHLNINQNANGRTDGKTDKINIRRTGTLTTAAEKQKSAKMTNMRKSDNICLQLRYETNYKQTTSSPYNTKFQKTKLPKTHNPPGRPWLFETIYTYMPSIPAIYKPRTSKIRPGSAPPKVKQPHASTRSLDLLGPPAG